MPRKSVLFALFVVSACGGKAPPLASPPTTVPAVATVPAGPVETDVLSPPILIDHLAPRPRIRVGLTTRAEVVRLTAPQPFVLFAGDQKLRTHDLLVEREVLVGAEGVVFRVQIASSPDRERARNLLRTLEVETGTSGDIAREAGSGRYAVRVGTWSTEQGAVAEKEELARRGYEGLRIVSEPSSSHRPRRLVLRSAESPPIYTSAMSLTAWPASSNAWLEVDEAPYRGVIEIRVNASNRFTVINELNLEDYLLGVVPAELSPAAFPEPEAIKAQAVAARTYAVKHRGQFMAEGFDICDTPACQVYRGAGDEQRMSNEAVAATRGELLTYGGKPVDAMYTSTCGGRTENVENVFDGPSLPYLVSRLCYRESPIVELRAAASKALSLELAGAVTLGVIPEEELAALEVSQPATETEFARWSASAFRSLGQTQCKTISGGNGQVSAGQFARSLVGALCWDGRLPFLLSNLDTDRLVPTEDAPHLSQGERRMLAHWIEEGVIQPSKDGFDPQRALTRREVLESLYRLLNTRGDPLLRSARFLDLEDGKLRLDVDDSEELLELARRRYLFRRVEDWTYFSPHLSVMPDDRVQFHDGDEGIDLLVLLSRGGSFDRSSRFSRWVVRKTSAELTESVNARASVGSVTDLRPLRYGRSGRVAELEVVGTKGSTVLTGLSIRWGLGIRENLFFVDRQLGPDLQAAAWVFTGRGWGHGVGLCQVGAYGMAVAGYDYKEILAHYYPGTTISLEPPVDPTAR